MGCDIHAIAEVKIDGRWRINTDKVFPNPWYEKGSTDGYSKHKYNDYPEDGRSYDWFAVLADVRNGRGFAGSVTGSGFSVIAQPRGVPPYCSPEWRKTVMDWGRDMHSHSYLYVDDFENFDWEQGQAEKYGTLNLKEYKKYRKTGELPEEVNGTVWGAKVRTLDSEDADDYLDGKLDLGFDDTGVPQDPKHVFVKVQWTVNYADYFDYKLNTWVEPLKKLEKKYEDARVVFAFDN